MITISTVKYFEDGKMIAEFDDLQVFTDFVMTRQRRKVEADFILQRKARENKIKVTWYIIGLAVGTLIPLIIKYFNK